MNFTPFFINSNIVTNEISLRNYDSFMNAVAGNTGNSYITWALLKELGVSELKDEFHIQCIYDFDFSKTDEVSEFVNSSCTHVFLILQDQIRITESYGYRLPYEGIKNLLEKIQKPVIVAGLGANSFTGFDPEFYKQLSPALVDFLHYLSNRCSELGVRGNFTAEVLDNLGLKNVVPLGCPSFFERGKNRIITKRDKLLPEKLFFTFANYPSPLNRSANSVCQDHQEADIIKAIAFDLPETISENEFYRKKYLKKQFHVFSNISDWKYFASNFDFSIGYRVHGTILSLNSNCLSVCCNGDSRATEMCELLKIPHMPNLDSNTNLIELYDNIDVSELNNSYPRLYQNFEDFIRRNCDVTIFDKSTDQIDMKQPSLPLYENHSENSIKIVYQYTERRLSEQENRIAVQENYLAEQKTCISKQEIRISEQERQIIELQSKLESTYNLLVNTRHRTLYGACAWLWHKIFK